MSAGKYDASLFAETDFILQESKPKIELHDCVCTMNKGTYTRLSYNTNNEE